MNDEKQELDLAYRLFKQDKFAEVIEHCTYALQQRPDFAEAYMLRAIARSIDNPEGALADLDEAIRLNSALAKAWNARGLIYAERGRYQDAITEYTEAIRLDPKCAAFYSNRGSACRNMGRFDVAIDDFTMAIHLDSGNPYHYYTRGTVYNLNADDQKAIEDLQKYLDLSGSSLDGKLEKFILELMKRLEES